MQVMEPDNNWWLSELDSSLAELDQLRIRSRSGRRLCDASTAPVNGQEYGRLCQTPAAEGSKFCKMHSKPRCQGMTALRTASASHPEIPPRPCAKPAWNDTDYCRLHQAPAAPEPKSSRRIRYRA